MRAWLTVIFCVAVTIISCANGPGNSDSSVFRLEAQDERVEILLDGRPLTTFHFHSKWDKPFLHPIRTPSQSVLSRGWPVAQREGDEQDHAWHRGIWYGHGDINGEDFWREKPDRTTARLVMDGAPKISSGNKGILEITLAMIGTRGNRLGTIGERYEFRREGGNLLMDSVVSVAADRDVALRFGDTDDGGFGFRLATEFRQDRGAELLNSEGLTGTEKIWGKPARWVKYTATINGKRAGVAMMDHPSNLRHPTGWHARGYSLCSANPFAAGSFAKGKNRDGSYTLPPGQTLKLRYLVVVFDGDLKAPAADRLFARFAEEK